LQLKLIDNQLISFNFEPNKTMVQKTILHSIFYASVLIFYNTTLKAQAPNLGAASSFGVFTSVGAFNNTGSSLIVGDAGTNVGAFNGSPTVTGNVHVADTTSANAANDLAAAYSDLFVLTCDSALSSTLGNNQILLPNIYCIGSAASFTDTLYLDAQNDSTAIFVFQIDGALSAANFSNVILINKASSCNVYWQINGAVDIGDSSDFKGIIIANGAISFYTGANLEGKALSIAGAISLASNTVNDCKQSLTVLSVALLSFEIRDIQIGKSISIEWQFVNDIGHSEFEIERSNDNINYHKIGTVFSEFHQGELEDFIFVDNEPRYGANFYRLKQTDVNGMVEYSKVLLALNSSLGIEFILFPNPFNEFITITLTAESAIDEYQFRLFNIWGIEVVNVTLIDNTNIIDLSRMNSGLYTYSITDSNDHTDIGKLVKL